MSEGSCIHWIGHGVQVAVRDEYESDSDEDAEAQEHDENTVPNCAPLRQQMPKDTKQPIISLRADCSDAAAGESKTSHIATASGAQQDDLPGSSGASEQTNCVPPDTKEGPDSVASPRRDAHSDEGEAKEAEIAAASAEGGCAREEKTLAENHGNTAASTGASAAQPEQAVPRMGAAAKPARPKRVWREGTALSAGLRLMCYCQRHTALLGAATGKTRMSIVTGLPIRSLHSPNKPAAPAHLPAAPDATTAASTAPTNTAAHPGEPAFA